MIPNTVNREVLDRLRESEGSSLVSIFIPTHSRGRDVEQDRIRLKNQLAVADQTLEGLGRKPRARSERLAKATEMLEDREFWEHQSAGLAVYISEEGEVTALSLSNSVGASTMVMPAFQLRPLLRTLELPEVNVLALTRDRVALFVVRGETLEPIDADLPESMEDVNWFVDRENQRQQHPDRAGSTRNRHGHEPGENREDLNRFLREVGSSLPAEANEPLIVLGDDDLVARFGNLLERKIVSPDSSGLPADFTDSQIHSTVLPILEDIATQHERKVVEDAKSAIGMGQAVTDLGSAVPDAASGRIGQLVIDPEAPSVWGRFDATDYSVAVHDERRPADVDLVDRLVLLSVETGADVVPVDGDLLDNPFVAIRRF